MGPIPTLTHEAKELALRPQSFDVLTCLAERAGRVVSKDELIAAVWETKPASDDSLVQCIADIRQVLGEDARSIIRTVPRHMVLLGGAGCRSRRRLGGRRAMAAKSGRRAGIFPISVPWLAVAYAGLGREEEGRALIEEHMNGGKRLTIAGWNKRVPPKTGVLGEQRARILAMLRRLGVPEGKVRAGRAQ